MANILEDKVVLITGASRGIGKVIALQMAKDGARVVVTARTETPTDEYPGSIHETVKQISAMGGAGIALRLDVTDDAAIKDVVHKVKGEYGRIDVLVNNAGILGGGGPFLGGDPELLDRFYRTNLRAPYVLSQLVGQEMASNDGGVIFNISSGLARIRQFSPANSGGGMGGHGPGAVYGATKAALDRFAAGVAAELHAKNVAIINIYPGFTITERMIRNLPPGADTSRMEKPETTAKTISFLCQDPMHYTGQIVVARELAEKHNL